MKQLVLTTALFAVLGMAGCSQSSSNSNLKSVDPSKIEPPKAVGGAKDKANATSAPSVAR